MRFFVSILGLSAWALWGYAVTSVDPNVPMAPVGFYLALFVALTCTLSRLLAGPGAPVEGQPNPGLNLGHAAIVSVLLLFALWLQSLRMLTSLNGILLAALFGFIELGFFLSGGGRRSRPRRRPRRTASPVADVVTE